MKFGMVINWLKYDPMLPSGWDVGLQIDFFLLLLQTFNISQSQNLSTLCGLWVCADKALVL